MGDIVWYIICHEEKRFYIFNNRPEAQQKEDELAKIYGYRENKYFPNSKVPKYIIDFKTLKGYYGTVWLASKWNDDCVSYVLHSHYNKIKGRKQDGYKIRKIVFEEYNNPTVEYWVESNKQTIVKKGFPGVRRRSPGFD